MMSETQERTWAMWCHLGSLFGNLVPMGFLAIPLVLWLMKKDESFFVDDQGREVLNFQLSFLLYVFVLCLFVFIFGLIAVAVIINLYGHSVLGRHHFKLASLGFLLVVLVMIFTEIVFVVQGAVSAYRGNRFRYPLTIRFIR